MDRTRFMSRMFTSAVLLSTILLVSCASAAAPAEQSDSRQLANAPAARAEADAAGDAISDTGDSQQATQRLIIRNANLTIVVQDTQAQVTNVTKLADELKGYIASSSTRKYNEGLQATITLRIPADQLDVALDRLHKMAVEVRSEQITGQDVTAEYTDLNSRLKNLDAAEAQLRELMSKADKTEDVLAVYRELVQKRGEIEQVKGRMQYLSQSAAMATINVTMIPDTLAGPLQVAGWRPEGVLKSAVEALISGLQIVLTIGIWLIIVIIPIGLLIASPFILVAWLIRRRRKNKMQTKIENPIK